MSTWGGAIRSFYQTYSKLHTVVAQEATGLDDEHRDWYASVILLRLMVVYFLQKESLLGGNVHYLTEAYTAVVQRDGSFSEEVLQPLFLSGLNGALKRLGIATARFFAPHLIEQTGPTVRIPNETFETIFAHFEKYRWALTEPNCHDSKVITPALLEAIFEKHINQKQMGAYYTPRDVRTYISNYALLPCIIQKLDDIQPELLREGGLLASLLQRDINRYIHPAARYGLARPLPVAYDLDAVADSNWGLPLETWRDVISRRKRYALVVETVGRQPLTLHRLIALNLNIVQLVMDLISYCDWDVLEHFFAVIAGDAQKGIPPLRVIDPTCGSGVFLSAAAEILTDLYTACILRMEECRRPTALFRRVIVDCAARGIGLFALCSTIQNNLYGVDIMPEAVEMARVKLQLAMVAAGRGCPQSFPLPEPNLYSGNALTGSVWREFTTVFQDRGGFDCIIGNPPYVEYRQVKGYSVAGYRTEACGNLYAFVVERSIDLLRPGGFLGLIVPISIVSTPRMAPLRSTLMEECCSLFYSNFADRPGTLFQGVHQKLTIVLAQKKEEARQPLQLFTSGYYHWYAHSRANEREALLENIQYIQHVDHKCGQKQCIRKFGQEIELSIWKKMQTKNASLLDIFQSRQTSYAVYLNKRMNFWAKCFLTPKKSREYKPFFVTSEKQAKAVMAVLNSSLFFYFWELVSDGWHITRKDLALFKLDLETMEHTLLQDLAILGQSVEDDLEKNKGYIGSVQTEYAYYHKKSKSLIDQIDHCLGVHFKSIPA